MEAAKLPVWTFSERHRQRLPIGLQDWHPFLLWQSLLKLSWPRHRCLRERQRARPSASTHKGREIKPNLSPKLVATRGNALATRMGQPITPHIGSADFNVMVNTLTKSTARGSNDVRVLFDGQASFAERMRLIAGATRSVDLQTFIFASDDTGWSMARALADKAREGIPVRVIIDGVGSHNADSNMIAMMREAGVDLRIHGDILGPNQLWHEKHLVIDGEVAINGGMNIADKYALGGSGRQVLGAGGTSSSPWRDVDVRVEGASVLDVQRAFLRNWLHIGGTLRDQEWFGCGHRPDNGADTRVRVVQHRPIEDGDDHTQLLYLASIRGAQRTIRIENAYFVPTPDLHAALIDAARRGVDVQIMTNSDTSNDMGFVTDCSRAYYPELLAAGVRIFERNGDSTLHSKTASFDGVYSLIGSCNFNGRSVKYDAEVVLAIDGTDTAQQLDERFRSGLHEATEIRADDEVLSGLMNRLRQRLLRVLSSLF
jgi:cardiolipin synthase A/B